MSIETWKKEFYPMGAQNLAGSPFSTPVNLVKHSLLKWQGMRPEVLEKHGLTRQNVGEYSTVVLSSHGYLDFPVDASSCALCVAYGGGEDYCTDPDGIVCPLKEVRGGYQCDDDMPSEDISPYEAFKHDGNPEPMIECLKEALNDLEKKS